jgi:transposase
MTMKAISVETRDRIIACVDNDMSDRKIAISVGVSRFSVQNVRKQHCPQAITARSGRQPKLSAQTTRLLVRSVTSSELDTAVAANKRLKQELNVHVSDETVHRTLVEAGLEASAKIEKPMLSKKNVTARLAFAKRHQHWTVADWEQVIWPDKTKINRFSSDGHSWCWTRDVNSLERRTVKQTVKHGGGSIMIWGCMAIYGPGFMCKLDGTMVKETYKSILQDELMATIDYYDMNPAKVIF